MRIAIGSDHAGFDLKDYLYRELQKFEYEMIDCGTNGPESVDYPDYARAVSEHVLSGEARFGIGVCGTGVGISIAANKIHGIRAALCHTEFSARMARQHNNANVLALGDRVLGTELALSITLAFLAESFTDVGRHKKRIQKMMDLERRDKS